MDAELKETLDAIRQEMAEMRGENLAMHAATREEMAAMGGELRSEMATMRDENLAMHAATREEMASMRDDNAAIRDQNLAMHTATRTEMATLRDEYLQMHLETRREFHIVAEALTSKIELIAEGVGVVSEKLDREAADIRREMRAGFADTHALIHFSHRTH